MDEKNLEDMQQKQKVATTIFCDNLFTIAMTKKILFITAAQDTLISDITS